MIKKLLFLLLIPTICFADSIWGTRYNSWTRTNDWYKNFVSSATYSTTSSISDYSITAQAISVNVKAFGAVGDGVTDDTARIQAAMDSLGITGGIVNFPVGTYITTALTMPVRCKLQGYGKYASILKSSSNVSMGLINLPIEGGETFCSIDDIVIDGSNKTGSAIYISSNCYFSANNLMIANMTTGINSTVSGAYFNKLDNIFFSGMTNDILLDNQVNALRINNCDFSGINSIISADTFVGDDIIISGCTFEGAGVANSIKLRIANSTYSGYNRLAVIENNRFDPNGGTTGVLVDIGENIRADIKNNAFMSGQSNLLTISGKSVKVASNFFADSTGAAILLSATSTGCAIYEQTWGDGSRTCASKFRDLGNNNFIEENFRVNASSISIGSLDAYSRLQIWDYQPTSILRLGSLKRNFDTYDIPSNGIVVYGEDPNNEMANSIYGYARIKPYRFGLYTSSNTGESYKFLCDLQTDSFYLKDNNDNYVFKVTKTPPVMNVYGNIISSNVYADNGYFANIAASTASLKTDLDLKLSTGVVQIIAGTNISIDPADGHGFVTINASSGTGGAGDMFRNIDGVQIAASTATLYNQILTKFTNPAVAPLTMNDYGIINSSYVYISTGIGQGYFQISDKYIVVSGTRSADIQNAINALGSAGGTVELIAGTYAISSQINVFKNNVTIRGHGVGTNLLANTWATWTAVGHVFYSSGTTGLIIRDLKIDGLAANTGQTKNLIHIQKSTYLRFQNLCLDYSDNHGLYVEGSNYVHIDKCNITNPDVAGVLLYGYDNIAGAYSGGYETIVEGNNIVGASQGITVQYCRAVQVLDNEIWNSTAWGIQSDQLNYGFSIIGNVIFGGTGGGIYFYGTTTNGFNCTANTISCANVGILVQGDISAGSLIGNTITVTGAHNGIEIGSYNLVSGINVIANTISIAGGALKAGINAFNMSNSQIAFNNLTNTAARESCGFLLQAGTGNVITSNLAKNHTTDYQLNAFCSSNKLLNNTANDAIKIRDLANNTDLAIVQDAKWGFGVSSPTATVDATGGSFKASTATVTSLFYLPNVATLPTTGVLEGAFFYCTTDKKQWHSTETVTGAWSYVNP